MRIIKRPYSDYTKEDYFNLFEKVVEQFKNNDSVICISTFGGVNQPGISDIDLLITFKKGESYEGNIIEHLSEKEKKLFTHGIMALSEEHWYKNKAYALWDNEKVIYGNPPQGDVITLNDEELNSIKKQTALEFLFTNFIDLSLQKEYNIIKLRDLLQHTKGIIYDLKYLGLENRIIEAYVTNVKDWIRNWHNQQPTDRELVIWFNDFYMAYTKFISSIFEDHAIYLPKVDSLQFSKNISLLPSTKVSYNRKGIVIPHLNEKYTQKLLNKLNRFEFYLPITSTPENRILESRINFFKEMKIYNQQNFPRLGLLTTSLMSKIV